MTINNILCVDDNEDWRESFQSHFKENLTPNVDIAEDYDSAMQKIRQTKYDLIVLDSLEGKCFEIYQDIQNIPHGDVIIFSADDEIRKEAMKRDIPFYDKLEVAKELKKIFDKYKQNNS